ncbi:MAG: signal recognition particle-docking protein FtsY [Spiroplasma sp.]
MAIFAKLKAKLFGTKSNKYDQGLRKSRSSFTEKLKSLSSKYQIINQEYFDELEEVLISADVGYTMASKIVSEVNQEAKKRKIIKSEEINEIILDKMFVIYTDGEVISTRLNFNEKGLTCFLIVGVNGSGKTTTLAKLAYKLKEMNKKSLLVAADTFRAGAVEQLKLWAQKLDVAIVEPTKPQQDPASVVFQGVAQALKNNYDVVLIDTAGRLENKVNLMQELNKINKIIKQKLEHESDEILLVLDATTGQNGIIQAQEFAKIVPVSGIVLTKMDGTAKGGIILAVKEYLGLPVKLVGLGEQATDLEEFDLDQYLYNLTSDLFIGAKNE